MTTRPLELFYSYAREDEALRDKLNDHLVMLKRQGFIRDWSDRNINAGNEWAQKINAHLKSADIILLLISSSFLASEYCYSLEMAEALRRHEAGEACVIPIILRTCDWKSAPFGKLQALPRDARPVTKWRDRDEAFTDIAKGIHKAIVEINSTGYDTEEPPPQRSGKTRKRAGNGMEEGASRTMKETPRTIKRNGMEGGTSRTINRHARDEIGAYIPVSQETPRTINRHARDEIGAYTVLKRAIDKYYKALKEYEGRAEHEQALRSAFQYLLDEAAHVVKWKLIPEQTIEGRIRPDGVLRDEFDLRRGIWEAKDLQDNLEAEIKKKIADGYPLTNAIFENTRQAVLYQNKKRFAEYDLTKTNDVHDLLTQFLTYTEPDIENFEAAVSEFKERIPELASKLRDTIEKEHKQNRAFSAAFESFAELCRTTLDPKISSAAIDEMLVQHLLTERLFRTVFDNPDFVRRNVIAAKIEEVIQALTSRSFNRQEFLRSLDRFYVAIEGAARNNGDWSERQHFLNTVYERFFQGFSVKQADVLGTVYTPQEIVDFMVASVDEVLKQEFGTAISEPGVKILDPSVGTGSYIVNIMHRIPPYQLKHKYQQDLFCNEIALLPYYIASMNIEHEYYEKMGQYEPFEGLCFADSLELAEGQQLSLFVEENTERVQREKDAQIMVVIGNPPYNVGQKSENDNNKNRKYPIIDERIRETYTKYSKATNRNALSDAYVKFFRWATDRLGDRDGIVCYVSNNGFLTGFAFDGFRKQLDEEFSQVYHLDLGGNARKREGGNVFGIMVGVGITILVRHRQGIAKTDQAAATLHYYKVPEQLRSIEKLALLKEMKNITSIPWQQLHPDSRYTWITEGLDADFDSFLPIGTKESKAGRFAEISTVFQNYGRGVATCRDDWAYDFSKERLIEKIGRFIDTYNGQVDAWKRRGNSKKTVDEFVIYEDDKIKWSRDLKLDLQRGHYATYNDEKIRTSLYRPFCKRFLFFDRILNEEVYQFPQFFPTSASQTENIVIWLKVGSEWPMFALATNVIPDLLPQGGSQCFPFYTYAEDGTNRRENITDWALKQFQDRYGSDITKWDIFHYVYGLLHHPQYRERYKENLKRDLPHIPLLHQREKFLNCVQIGKQLMELHLNYEQAREYFPEPLPSKEAVPLSWRVEKMRLSTDRRVVVVNDSLRFGPLPPECFEYRLGNRSALEWVIDQYQVTKDKRSGIESDPNRLDDEEYIVRLVGRVVTVSVETVKLVNALAREITAEDWL